MNVVWFCTDQQRWDTLACYQNEFVKTPNIDRLAKMGVKFNRAYSQSPVCTPSRASFLTGRYPRVTGARQNGQDINPTERVVPRILADNGYTCGLSGKLHITACHPNVRNIHEPRINDGYHYYRWSQHPESVKTRKDLSWPTNDYIMWLSSQGIEYGREEVENCKYVQYGMPEEYHQTTWTVNCAIEYIDSARKSQIPWLFSLNPYAPHHPFDPPKKYLDKYMDLLDKIPMPNYEEGELDNKPYFQQRDHKAAYGAKGYFGYTDMCERDHKLLRASYWAMCEMIDNQVGRLLDYLEESNQLDDTIFIYTSDHGEALGDHGIYLKGPYFYDENVRVPLIISCPSKIKGGRETDELVEVVDIAPTIIEALGLPKEEGMQGKSLWDFLTGKTDKHRKNIYSECYNAGFNRDGTGAFDTMVFDGRYKLVKIHDLNDDFEIKGELYDLEIDPQERYNKYYDPEYTEIKRAMLELMADRMAQTCDPLPTRLDVW